jgi:mannan endo-1,4-beta-mannosidase
VDIVGIDIYNNTSTYDINTRCYKFLRKYSPDKMVALTEFGNVAKISAQWRAGSKWLFFMPWYDYERTKDPSSAAFKSTDHGSANAEWWADAFACDFVLTRDDFRELRTSIRDIQAAERLAAPTGTYDLMGRPWVEGSRGVMIHNGKKYMRK